MFAETNFGIFPLIFASSTQPDKKPNSTLMDIKANRELADQRTSFIGKWNWATKEIIEGLQNRDYNYGS